MEGVRSELAVPLINRGRVIGVLDIESSQPDYFTPDQQNILTLVAARIGGAIENARLFEHERNQAETFCCSTKWAAKRTRRCPSKKCCAALRS